ncbi:MAG: trimethylamine methyltransferase family protein [Lentisphaerae bacterium]|nr:trimethylamine methyltransferase family protein [Lentisphaerota bacterium]
MELIKTLSSAQIRKIQAGTEDLLENTGFFVGHKALLAKCKAAGAIVDDVRSHVRIPRKLLNELLASVPSTYTIGWPDGSRHEIGGGRQKILAIVTDPWIADYATRKPRRPSLADVRAHTILAQRLEDVAIISRMDFPVTDAPGPASSLRALEEHLLHHRKHMLVIVTSLESWRQWLEIGAILAPGKSLAESRLFSAAVAVVSPLSLVDFNAEILLSAAERHFPIVPTICPMAGSTAPYSMASTLLIGNTESIMVAALSQIVSPGTPFQYASGLSVTDMRSMHDLYYTMDKVLWKTAAVQLAKAYSMPVTAECGGAMSCRTDPQTGAEGMLFMLAAANSGADILAGLGSCYNANGMSAEMMILQTAWLEAARYLGKGIDTHAGRLGLDSIRRAGPGGNFVDDAMTVKLLRAGEFFANDLFDVSGEFGDGPSMLERAHRKVGELTAGFQSPVPAAIQNDLRAWFDRECAKAK